MGPFALRFVENEYREPDLRSSCDVYLQIRSREHTPRVSNAIDERLLLLFSTMTSKVLRVPKLDLNAVLAQQNPQIDLRLDAYEASTRNFLTEVSNYTQRAVAEITHRKNVYAAEKKRLAEKTQQIHAETNQCKVKEIELIGFNYG